MVCVGRRREGVEREWEGEVVNCYGRSCTIGVVRAGVHLGYVEIWKLQWCPGRIRLARNCFRSIHRANGRSRVWHVEMHTFEHGTSRD